MDGKRTSGCDMRDCTAAAAEFAAAAAADAAWAAAAAAAAVRAAAAVAAAACAVARACSSNCTAEAFSFFTTGDFRVMMGFTTTGALLVAGGSAGGLRLMGVLTGARSSLSRFRRPPLETLQRV